MSDEKRNVVMSWEADYDTGRMLCLYLDTEVADKFGYSAGTDFTFNDLRYVVSKREDKTPEMRTTLHLELLDKAGLERMNQARDLLYKGAYEAIELTADADRFTVNKRTHQIRHENETEDAVTIVVEPKAGGLNGND